MNYYQRNIGDIMKKTHGLSLAQRGAYDLMMDLYYDTERPFPLDDAKRHDALGATTRADRAVFDYVLRRFFVEHPDGWHNKRCDEELDAYRRKSKTAAHSADIRWERERALQAAENEAKRPPGELPTDSGRNADAMRSHSDGNANHEPLTINQEPPRSPKEPESGVKPRARRPKPAAVALPPWMPKKPWDDFLDWRQRKGSPMTERAQELAIMKLEAMREGGQDPGAVLNQSVLCGWTSLRPVRPEFADAPQSEAGRRNGLTQSGAATAAAAERWMAENKR